MESAILSHRQASLHICIGLFLVTAVLDTTSTMMTHTALSWGSWIKFGGKLTQHIVAFWEVYIHSAGGMTVFSYAFMCMGMIMQICTYMSCKMCSSNHLSHNMSHHLLLDITRAMRVHLLIVGLSTCVIELISDEMCTLALTGCGSNKYMKLFEGTSGG